MKISALYEYVGVRFEEGCMYDYIAVHAVINNLITRLETSIRALVGLSYY